MGWSRSRPTLKGLVEAHLRVPREKRASFNVWSDTGGTHVMHQGLGDWMLDAAHSDLEVLALSNLLNARVDVRGRMSHLTVLPAALDYYEGLNRREAAFEESDADDPFTEPEIAQIDAGIERVRAYLRDANVSPEKMGPIERRLNYLRRAARRYGRRGWRIVAGHLIWDIAVAAAFAPERAEELLRELLSGIAGFLPG